VLIVKLAYAAVAALLFAVAAPAFAAAPAAPIALKNKQGDVTFDHSKHAKVDCTKCHADAKGGKMAPLGKEKGHATCLDCHKAEAKGPTKCNECHKKA
jgi:predicted CXXCH cytochrome family protein